MKTYETYKPSRLSIGIFDQKLLKETKIIYSADDLSDECIEDDDFVPEIEEIPLDVFIREEYPG